MKSDEHYLDMAQRDLAFNGLGETEYHARCCNCQYKGRRSPSKDAVIRLAAAHKQTKAHMVIVYEHKVKVEVLSWAIQGELYLINEPPPF
jgi:hypothetical protein